MCRRSVSLLHYLDVFGRIIPYDVTAQWPQIECRFGRLDLDAHFRDIHVINSDGRTYCGFDAYRQLAWVVPLAWSILPVLYLPPVRWLGWRLYRNIADHQRFRSCPLRA